MSTGRLVVEPPRWRLAVPIVLLVVAGWAVAFGIWWNSTRVYQSDRTVPVIAILPFANNSAKPGDAPIAAAMRDVLIANLANLQGINVLSKSATGNAGAQPERSEEAVQDLGITYLIDGSLQRSGDDLMVSVSLVRGESGLVVWSGSYSAPEKDIFALQGRIADGVSHAGPIGTSGAVQTRDSKLGTSDVEALSRCGEAVEALERPDIPGNLQRAATLLNSAIDRDPKFALAFARLGEAHWATYQVTSETKWATEAAIATSKALTLAQRQAGSLDLTRADPPGHRAAGQALGELKKALELQPNSDEAHRLMGLVLQSLERLKEAEEHYLKAVALGPNYWRHYSQLGAFYYATGRSRDAVAAFTRVTEMQPDNARGFNNLGAAYYALGDNANALKSTSARWRLRRCRRRFRTSAPSTSMSVGTRRRACRSSRRLPPRRTTGCCGQSRGRPGAPESPRRGAPGMARGGASGPTGPGGEPERRDDARADRPA